MRRSLGKTREEARRLYLTGELTTNAEIAARLKVKAHTIGRWRRDEDWDGLRFKIDRRAATMFVEKIASDRVTINVRHYRFWELVLAKLAEDLKSEAGPRFPRARTDRGDPRSSSEGAAPGQGHVDQRRDRGDDPGAVRGRDPAPHRRVRRLGEGERPR